MRNDEPYTDVLFYRQEFGGAFAGGDGELAEALERASVKIDAATLSRARNGGLTDFQNERFRLACCYQAQSDQEAGGDGVASYRIGDLSVTMAKPDAAARAGLCREAYELLSQSGLLYRGV